MLSVKVPDFSGLAALQPGLPEPVEPSIAGPSAIEPSAAEPSGLEPPPSAPAVDEPPVALAPLPPAHPWSYHPSRRGRCHLNHCHPSPLLSSPQFPELRQCPSCHRKQRFRPRRSCRQKRCFPPSEWCRRNHRWCLPTPCRRNRASRRCGYRRNRASRRFGCRRCSIGRSPKG
jgi:hypothetical protein